MTLSAVEYAPKNKSNPRQLVVFLHGLGADGRDLINLAPYFARALPEAKFFAPNAPSACDMAPMGYQWFSLQDRTPEVLWPLIVSAAPVLNNYLDGLLKQHGLADKDLALIGFSQGTMMALHTVLRRPQAIAGIVGFSGALLGGQYLVAEATAKPPVLLVHGEDDTIVPFAAMKQAAGSLANAGIKVQTLARPRLPHSIDEAGIEAAVQFLASCFQLA